LQISNPPDIFTVHHAGLFSEVGPAWLPPIVLGSTNRYMCNGNNYHFSGNILGTVIPPADMARVLRPLEEMLSGLPILRAGPDQHSVIPFDSALLENTRIEIYDHIRHCAVSGTSFDLEAAKRRPTDLSLVQAMLDERIGRWKGKVDLKGSGNTCRHLS
jgi:hypothetical protein